MNNLNHNRYLGHENIRSQREYECERNTPTFKQKKFFKSLIMMCKDHGLDLCTGSTVTRMEYCNAIDLLIKRLNEAGVDIRGNGKTATLVLTHKTDARNNEYMTTKRIVVGEKQNEENN